MISTTGTTSSSSTLGHNRTRPAVFIDGEAGTTGLEIRERLARLPAVDVRSIDPDKRKDPKTRQTIMADVDLVVLCLPDQAAKEATALADELGEKSPRIVDASTAHRVAEGWTYGFPEMDKGQAAAVRASKRVATPGCYPTGGIGLIRPLVAAGLIPADYPLTVNAVSGYSGGGKSMIESYDKGIAPLFELYGLGLEHKHVPELQVYSGLTRRPIFVPSVGNYLKGMLVSVPLHLDTLPGKPTAADLQACLEAHYAGSKLVKVVKAADTASKAGRLDALALNDTDFLELRVAGNEKHRQAVLIARLDNLGKGAAGAAVQNLCLMLGVET
ncbi:MAG: N-acetyl-gamma-glutamyl-phosphate reductase [Hyphomicrobiaceae bacterium]